MPGSGKGTQGKLLAQAFPGKYAYFEAGSVLRLFEQSNENAFSDYMKETIDKGLLVDDNFIIALFDAFLVTLHPGQAMIIDGFPRKLFQMYSFRDRIYKHKRDVVGLNFAVSQEETLKRLTLRARQDDTQAAIQERIDAYNEETLPVIKHFEQVGRLITIDANQSIEAIHADVLKRLTA